MTAYMTIHDCTLLLLHKCLPNVLHVRFLYTKSEVSWSLLVHVLVTLAADQCNEANCCACCLCCRPQWAQACGVPSHTPTLPRLRPSKAQSLLWATSTLSPALSASNTSCKSATCMTIGKLLHFETAFINSPYRLPEVSCCVVMPEIVAVDKQLSALLQWL